MQDLHSQADKGIQTDAVILDFSKAFDNVSHTRFAYKLIKYGVRGQTLSWIQDFLNNRTLQVVVDGRSSAPAPVTSGVPQGSDLGTILFLIYINDIPDSVKSHVRLFGNDTIIYNHIKVKNDQLQLQSVT